MTKFKFVLLTYVCFVWLFDVYNALLHKRNESAVKIVWKYVQSHGFKLKKIKNKNICKKNEPSVTHRSKIQGKFAFNSTNITLNIAKCTFFLI